MNLPILNCDNCGVCCMHMAVPPFCSGEEIATLPPNLQQELTAIYETRQIQFNATDSDWVPCAWFDWVTRQCRHHEHRPQVCREFEIGSEDCISARKRAFG